MDSKDPSMTCCDFCKEWNLNPALCSSQRRSVDLDRLPFVSRKNGILSAQGQWPHSPLYLTGRNLHPRPLAESVCGNVVLNSGGKIILVSQLVWDRETFLTKTDEKEAYLRNRTTTLELIGVLLPFFQIPDQLTNQHVVVRVG
jgi:hypothetical protein